MRMLRGVVYMLKMIGPRTEPWSRPQEKDMGDIKSEARTEKERDNK